MRLANELGGEIVSVDSMQVYRGLDIGTAKPSAADQAAVVHHLIDVADPKESFSVAEYQRLGVRAVDEILDRSVTPVLVGGSGLHFRALVDPLVFPPTDDAVRGEIEALDPADAVLELLAADPAAGEAVDLANPRRVARALEVYRVTGETPSTRRRSYGAIAVRNYTPRLPLIVIGIDPGDRLADRIEQRFDAMLEAGLLEEVAVVAPRLGVTAAQGVGYKELLPVTAGETTLEEGRAAAISATRALGKRQRTFFRRDPRISWIPWHDGAGNAVEDGVAAAIQSIEESAWTS